MGSGLLMVGVTCSDCRVTWRLHSHVKVSERVRTRRLHSYHNADWLTKNRHCAPAVEVKRGFLPMISSPSNVILKQVLS